MPSIQTRPIYLIVATSVSPALGIGLRGQLPWPPLKSDMSFFKRVTTRPPPPSARNNDLKVKNAAIMGRKTWDSIPPKFRPLRDRINVVVSRSQTANDPAGHSSSSSGSSEDLLVAATLPGAISALEKLHSDRNVEPGKTFIIGGSEVYRAAVEELAGSYGVPLRIIHTQVRRKDGGTIECDTFFPTPPGQTQLGSSGTESRRATAAEVEEWVGEKLPQRAAGNIVKGDDGDDAGDWLEEGEMQIRVLGEEITKRSEEG
jgi:dihydrofolate reductase